MKRMLPTVEWMAGDDKLNQFVTACHRNEDVNKDRRESTHIISILQIDDKWSDIEDLVCFLTENFANFRDCFAQLPVGTIPRFTFKNRPAAQLLDYILKNFYVFILGTACNLIFIFNVLKNDFFFYIESPFQDCFEFRLASHMLIKTDAKSKVFCPFYETHGLFSNKFWIILETFSKSKSDSLSLRLYHLHRHRAASIFENLYLLSALWTYQQRHFRQAYTSLQWNHHKQSHKSYHKDLLCCRFW